ncbi:DDHD domain-containing protein [Besnoitia besnoiti]|uniref:DDHD domain-containing protein n=1 Tax=Besnoitia besnoiti TaxID=94643 RepID=A0A2A9M8J5_BESBE|nr:DDHD domain-containing protein [Besnoitia besnoiti]PFH34305.1 DDHD domain-containing protein [Besnoitia besnoiti]
MAFSWFFSQDYDRTAPQGKHGRPAEDGKPERSPFSASSSVQTQGGGARDARVVTPEEGASGRALLRQLTSASSRRRPPQAGPVKIEFDDDDEDATSAASSYVRAPSQVATHKAFALRSRGGERAVETGAAPGAAARPRRDHREGGVHRKSREKRPYATESALSPALRALQEGKTAKMFSPPLRLESAVQRTDAAESLEKETSSRLTRHRSSQEVSLRRHDSIAPHAQRPLAAKDEDEDSDLVVGPKMSDRDRRPSTRFALRSRGATLASLSSSAQGLESRSMSATAGGMASGEGEGATVSAASFRAAVRANVRQCPAGQAATSRTGSEAEGRPRNQAARMAGLSPSSAQPSAASGWEVKSSWTTVRAGGAGADSPRTSEGGSSATSSRQSSGSGVRSETTSHDSASGAATPLSPRALSEHVTLSQSSPPESLEGPLPSTAAALSAEAASAVVPERRPLRSAGTRVSFAVSQSSNCGDKAAKTEKDVSLRRPGTTLHSPMLSPHGDRAAESKLRKGSSPRGGDGAGTPSSSSSTRISDPDPAVCSATSLSSEADLDAAGAPDRAGSDLKQPAGAKDTCAAEGGPQKGAPAASSGRPPCEHILLVVHGIGCEAEGGAIHKQQFVKSLALVNEYWFWRKPVEVHVHAINWKQTVIHAQEHMFEHITLKDVYETRRMLTLTAADLLFFLTPRYGDFIMTQVAEQLNEAVAKLRAHPSERYKDSKISVLGYSLGSVMAYELLAGRPFRPSLFDPATNPSPRLKFHVDSLFLLGSALPAFLLLHAPEILKQGMWVPKDLHLYNIFHPCDPVAFRLEKLVYPKIRQLPPPVLLAFWRTNGVQKWYEWDMNVQHAKNVLMQNITDFASTISNSLLSWWNPETGSDNPESISVLDSNATAALEAAKKSKQGLSLASFNSSAGGHPSTQGTKPGSSVRGPGGLRGPRGDPGGGDGGSDQRDAPASKVQEGLHAAAGGRNGALGRTQKRQGESKGNRSGKPGTEDDARLALRPADACAFRMRLKQTLPHVLARSKRVMDSSEDEDSSLSLSPESVLQIPTLSFLHVSRSSSGTSADVSSAASSHALSPSSRSSASARTSFSAEDISHVHERRKSLSDALRDGDGASSGAVKPSEKLAETATHLQVLRTIVAAVENSTEESNEARVPAENAIVAQNERAAVADREDAYSVKDAARALQATAAAKEPLRRRRLEDERGENGEKEDDAGKATCQALGVDEGDEDDVDQNIWDLLYRPTGKEKEAEGAVSDATTSSAGSGAFALEQLEQQEQETSRAMAQLATINEQTGPEVLPVRIDFQLQEDTAEHYLSSLAMLQSHFNYWKLKDVAFFILKCLTGTNPTLSYTDHLKQLECAARKAAAKAERESNEEERRKQLRLAAALHRRLDSFKGASSSGGTSRKGRQQHTKGSHSGQGETSGKPQSLGEPDDPFRPKKNAHRETLPESLVRDLADEAGRRAAGQRAHSVGEKETELPPEQTRLKSQPSSGSSYSDGLPSAARDFRDSSTSENASRHSQEDGSARL